MSFVVGGIIGYMHIAILLFLAAFYRQENKKKLYFHYFLIFIFAVVQIGLTSYIIYYEIANNPKEIWMNNFRKSLFIFSFFFFGYGSAFILYRNQILEDLKRVNIYININIPDKAYVIAGVILIILALIFVFI